MKARYQPITGVDCYFAKDGSGVVLYCGVTGETHFCHVDSHVMHALLAKPSFCLEELGGALSLDSSEAAELADQLSALGLIDEIDQ